MASDLSSIARRQLLAALAALPLTRTALAAQGPFPQRPLRMVVPYPAGGSTDIVARLVAKALGESLPGTVVVENKAGAAGAIGSADVARSAADGYTLLAHIVTSAVLTPLFQARTLSYDPLAAFQPVALVAKLPNVLVVRKDLPVRNLAELARWLRAHPEQASYGTGGTGSIMHLTGEMLRREAGLEMTHVPYKGAAPAMQDLMGGNLAAVLDNITGVIGAVRSGSVRALGVSTDQRSAALPDVPTMQEQGLAGFSNSSWFGIFTRAGCPPEVLRRLEQATLQACGQPSVREQLSELGAVVSPLGSQEFMRFWQSEFKYWRQAMAQTPGAAQ